MTRCCLVAPVFSVKIHGGARITATTSNRSYGHRFATVLAVIGVPVRAGRCVGPREHSTEAYPEQPRFRPTPIGFDVAREISPIQTSDTYRGDRARCIVFWLFTSIKKKSKRIVVSLVLFLKGASPYFSHSVHDDAASRFPRCKSIPQIYRCRSRVDAGDGRRANMPELIDVPSSCAILIKNLCQSTCLAMTLEKVEAYFFFILYGIFNLNLG